MKKPWTKIADLIVHQLYALHYVITVILPVIIRTGKRPVLFDKYSGIGDIVCTIPAALALKKRHPRHTFIYNSHREYTCLPKLGGVTDLVTSNPHIGHVYYWYKFLLAASYNFASDDDYLVSHSELYIKGFGTRHGVEVGESHPILHVRQETIEHVTNILNSKGIDQKHLIVIHLGPTWPVKEWPLKSWMELISNLNNCGFRSIVHLGVSKHLALGPRNLDAIPGTIPIFNQLSLEESIALISLGVLFIGVDSGLLHCAVSLRTPAIGLWGATSPKFLFSSTECSSFIISKENCQGCHHRFPRLHWKTGCPNNIACMKSISADEVMTACLYQLHNSQ